MISSRFLFVKSLHHRIIKASPAATDFASLYKRSYRQHPQLRTIMTDTIGREDDKKRPRDDDSDSKIKKKKDDNTRRGFDVNVDERERPPHEGSFANPSLREQFGISLEPRTIVGEDQKILKRKVALVLGFLGTRYGGFQVNANQRTIQAEIELALYRSGLLKDFNFGLPHKYSWSSSARTDKGVHACAQVCSCKVDLLASDVQNDNDLDVVRKRVQEYLPSDICILDMIRTTRNMCAKTQRDRARYQYMIPSFLFHPNWRQVLIDQGIPLEGRIEVAYAPLTPEEIKKVKSVIESYRSTEEQRKLLSTALAKYEGTNPFHNFTKGLRPGQPQANRFIESFHAQDPVVIDGVEWIPTQVLGQSFLLHQIRKMISMAIDVARGAVPMGVLEKALNKEKIVRVGVAPAQGLFLEMSYFGGYNRRKTQSQGLPDLDLSKEGPAKERWRAFRDKIREHIVAEEKEQGNFIQYIYVQECIFDYKKFYNLDEDGNMRTGDAPEHEEKSADTIELEK